MSAKNRFSVSFSDEEMNLLERLSIHTHKTKSEIVRSIISKYISENPEAFRRQTNKPIKRATSIVLGDTEE